MKDSYTAHANRDFCSADFSKQFLHGKRKGGETETVDRSHATVSRVTLNGGGKSEFAVPDCTKDALTLLYYARRELGQGRVPAASKVFFGSGYEVKMVYTGAMDIPVAGKPVTTDHLNIGVKGPASEFTFEIFYARDPARTPLLIKIPVSVGTISLELVR